MPPRSGRLTRNFPPLFHGQFLSASLPSFLAAKPSEGNSIGVLLARRLFRRFTGRFCRYRSSQLVEVARLA
ncbi:MAG: hypothetical protein ABR978_02130 [Dehalococcoidia bacterium]|jgi:hypothetical protein